LAYTKILAKAYTPPIASASRVAAEPFADILFFFHETESMEGLWGSGKALASAQLYIQGIAGKQWSGIKAGSKKDVRGGGGLYVYTRAAYAEATIKLGAGSVGSGMTYMLIFNKNLVDRNDWWATNTDLNGGIPMAFCKEADATEATAACSSKVKSTTNNLFDDVSNAKRPAGNGFGGQTDASLSARITELIALATADHQEQGFANSIDLATYLVGVVYKKGSLSKEEIKKMLKFKKVDGAYDEHQIQPLWTALDLDTKFDDFLIYKPGAVKINTLLTINAHH